MNVPVSPLTAAQVGEIGARIGLPVAESKRKAYADSLASELARYERLDSLSPPSVDREFKLADVVFDPGMDEDPHNAYVTRFTATDPDAGDELADLDVAIKDNMAVGGVPMTCGSRAFEAATPGENAAVVDRLLGAGATLTGKTNMDELAYGPTSETSGFGPVTNPADPSRVAGGSSSGSAALVAAGTIDAALGSDTGGSVRIPASFCGVVGFKPTWGTVPRTGVVDLAYTLDHVGPLAVDVKTVARVFDTIAGSHPADVSSALADRVPVGDFADASDAAPDVGDLELGIPVELLGDHVSDEVRTIFEEQVNELEGAGACFETVSIPLVEDAVPVWNAITNTELAAAFRRGFTPVDRRGPFDASWHVAAGSSLRGNDPGFGDVVRRKIILGTHLLERYGGRHYVRAQNVCDALYQEVADALEGLDALVTPTMPVVAPELGGRQPHVYSQDDGLDVPLAVNTRPADLVKMPAISIPAGRSDGLPVGIQFMGRRYEDRTVLQVGRTFEEFVAT